MTSYYPHFVRNYGKIAFPLIQKLKRDAFGWNDEAKNTFKALKLQLGFTLVLGLPDFSEAFEIKVDASELDLQTVLS